MIDLELNHKLRDRNRAIQEAERKQKQKQKQSEHETTRQKRLKLRDRKQRNRCKHSQQHAASEVHHACKYARETAPFALIIALDFLLPLLAIFLIYKVNQPNRLKPEE